MRTPKLATSLRHKGDECWIVFRVQRRRWGEISDPTHCGRNRPGRFPSGIAWKGTPVDFAKTCAVASTAAAMLFLLAVTAGLIAP